MVVEPGPIQAFSQEDEEIRALRGRGSTADGLGPRGAMISDKRGLGCGLYPCVLSCTHYLMSWTHLC